MIGVSKFYKWPFMRTESVSTNAQFWGVKTVAISQLNQ